MMNGKEDGGDTKHESRKFPYRYIRKYVFVIVPCRTMKKHCRSLFCGMCFIIFIWRLWWEEFLKKLHDTWPWVVTRSVSVDSTRRKTSYEPNELRQKHECRTLKTNIFIRCIWYKKKKNQLLHCRRRTGMLSIPKTDGVARRDLLGEKHATGVRLTHCTKRCQYTKARFSPDARDVPCVKRKKYTSDFSCPGKNASASPCRCLQITRVTQ